ncbi:cation:H+ antiporter [Anaerobranca californiensis DSM 14826]|jgi:cation:H+ antiporter|uniref:Cation:H+ antiporter n=1 Tax=Anaerobranca californiensis DSM 14826 TaxID=1120989 RepID=A0A1M6M8H2_9FIRM|nr:sodium:calcium antiporter [Anaerobranca californiensis]SHJ79742.1 cation:H+ antiporter [Anaerobranca californiensis DSM 14826]
MVWLYFFVSAALIVYAGMSLSKNADIIAEKTGLGGALIGALLLPVVTSLPEIVTSAQAAIIGNPDIAVGNVFGSNMFNIVIIAIVDLVQGRGPLMVHIKLGHILTAGVGILLSALAAIFIIIKMNIAIFGIGLDTLILLLVYLAGIRLILRYNKRHNLEEENGEGYPDIPLQKGIIGFIISGIIIVFSGRMLANTGNEIAQITGLGSSFVGSFLIAITTSLPELVATFTAAKMGAFDMAIGNILGANVMNILIIFLTDLFYVGNPVLSAISIENGITGLFGICLSIIAIIGIIYRSKKSVFTLGYDSWAIIIGYILAALLLFNLGITL